MRCEDVAIKEHLLIVKTVQTIEKFFSKYLTCWLKLIHTIALKYFVICGTFVIRLDKKIFW